MEDKLRFKGNIGNWAIGIIIIISLISSVYMLFESDKKVRSLKHQIENKEEFSIDEYEVELKKSLRENINSYIRDRYTKIPKEVASAIADNIMLYSEQYDISADLLVGMIEIESRFNPMATSSKDARGLMQVMPEWVPKLDIKNVNDLHDIDLGIEAGIKVFIIHLDEAQGNISKGLYLYVGKDSQYAKEVYSAVGRFVTYRNKKQRMKNDGTVE